jgi:hypothetical protein
MKFEVFVGIAIQQGQLNIAALDGSNHLSYASMSADRFGLESIKLFLQSYGADEHLSIAVSGQSALDVALSLTVCDKAQVFIVKSSAKNQPIDLIKYAQHAA